MSQQMFADSVMKFQNYYCTQFCFTEKRTALTCIIVLTLLRTVEQSEQ